MLYNKKIILFILIGFIALCTVIVFISGDNYQKYLNLTPRTVCIKTTEYRKQGNEEGCVTHYKTVRSNYIDRYGLEYEQFQMIDEQKASQKYMGLKDLFDKMKIISHNEVENSDLKKVTTLLDNQDNIYYVVQNNENVFFAYGKKEYKNRHQKWFDVILVEYEVK